MTFESRLVQGVYVIGNASVAKSMPKSGFSANSQAKIAALQIARALKNLSIVTPPKLANTCYSLIGPNYGISVAAVYEAHANTIVNLKKTHKSGGLSPMNADASFRLLEAQYAEGWYQNQVADIFS
jgi:sulfide dehydrogenase [flavocytochrome c] flavoprotein subunit